MKFTLLALAGFALVTATSANAHTAVLEYSGYSGNSNFYSPPVAETTNFGNQWPDTATQRSIARAIVAINKKDYGAAKTILAKIRPGQFFGQRSLAGIKFLTGLAYTGTNDLVSARSYFSEAEQVDRSFLDASVALSIINWHLGDRAASNAVLTSLVARQEGCRSKCSLSAEFDRVVPIVQKVVARK